MEGATIDTFLESLINLTAASAGIPADFDFRFCALDEEFQTEADELAKQTIQISRNLTSYILNQPVSEFDDEYVIDVDLAINELLGSRDMDILKKKPSKPVSFKPVEKKTIGDIKFFFSPTVTKPPKFVHNRKLPEIIPTLETVPVVITGEQPVLNTECLSVIAEPALLSESVDKIRSSCGGILYLSFLSHRVRTYRPFECVCVLMTPTFSVSIIDLIALQSCLDPLIALLQSEDIVKVMYAPDETLNVLAETLGTYVAPVVDACQTSGVPIEDAISDTVSLKKCVVDWRMRPINDELALIAAASVFYLPYLLKRKLDAMSPEAIISECKRFANPPPTEYILKGPEIEAAMSEIPGVGDMSETSVAILRDLVVWRDSVASLEDESPNFIASNQMLKNIASSVPLTLAEMEKTLQMASTMFLDSYKSDVLLIVKRACDYEEPTLSKILSVANP